MSSLQSAGHGPNTRPLFDSVRLALLAVAVGAVAGYAALGFLLLIGLFQIFFFGFSHDRVYTTLAELPTWRVMFAPVLGGFLMGFVMWKWLPGQRNYGPADVIEGIQEHDGKLPLRVGLSSALASAISIGAGASVGRYGPAVHLGASLSAAMARLLRLARGERIALVGSGVAAAIAASFNAPLGGVLFATEVMLGGRALRAFVPVTVAAVVGTAVTRMHGNDFHLFDLSFQDIQHLHEYPVFALTGALGGLLAVVLMRAMSTSVSLVGKSRLPVWLRPMIGGALLGLIGSSFPHVMGLGDEAVLHAYGTLFSVGLLLLLLALKIVATSISFGFGFSGGVFAPALFVGTMFGAAVGTLLAGMFPELVSTPSTYALVGMSAVISCVIGAPVATIVIVFELTSSYSLTTAVMVSVVFAHLVSRRVFPYSYFTHQLARRGVDVEMRREVQILRGRRLRDVFSDNYLSLAPMVSVDEAVTRYLSRPDVDMLVVDADGRLIGRVSIDELLRRSRDGGGEVAVADVATVPALVLQADIDLQHALAALKDFVGVSVPVVRGDGDMRLEGVIHESEVIDAYNDAVDQARAEEQGVR